MKTRSFFGNQVIRCVFLTGFLLTSAAGVIWIGDPTFAGATGNETVNDSLQKPLAVNTEAELVARVWDGGGATNNWSEAANWSGDTVPGTIDDAVFDGTSTKDSVVDINFAIVNLKINTGYSGTVSLGTGVTLTMNHAGLTSITSGTFDCGNGTFFLAGESAFTINGGTFNCENGTFSSNQNVGIFINAGTFEAPSGTMTLHATFAGSFVVGSGAVFNHNGGTFIFQGGGFTVNILPGAVGTLELNNLTINTIGQINLGDFPGDKFKVLGVLNLIEGHMNIHVEAQGPVNIAESMGLGGDAQTGTGLLQLTHGPATGVRTVVLPTLLDPIRFMPIELNDPQTTINTAGVGPFRLGALNLIDGTINAGNGEFSINGTTTQAGGVFNCDSGNIVFNQIGYTMSGSSSFNCTSATFIANNLALTLNPGSTFNAPLGTFTINSIFGSGFTRHNGATFNHNNGTMIVGGQAGTTFFLGFAPDSILDLNNLTINTTGQVGYGSAGTTKIVVHGTLNFVDGQMFGLTEAQGPVNIADTWGLSGPIGTVTSGTLQLTEVGATGTRTVTLPTLTNSDLFYGRIELNAPNTTLTANGPGPVRLHSLDLIAGTVNVATPAFSFNSTSSQSGGTFNCGNNTVSFNSAFFTLSGPNSSFNCADGTIDSAGFHLTLNGGTFNAPSGTMTFGGSLSGAFVRNPAATFNHNNGTVVFAPSGTMNIGIGGAAATQEFFNLTVNTGNSNLAFDDDSDRIRVLGNANLTSGAVQNATLEAQGNVTIGSGFHDDAGNAGRLAFGGPNDQTFTNNGGGNPRGTWTIDKSSGTVTAASNISLQTFPSPQALNITNGTLYLNENSNLAAGPITIGAGGRLVNDSSTTITLGGNLVNNGRVDLQGGGADCPGTDSILIRSTDATQRAWTGGGTYRLVDVDVLNMAGTGTKRAFSSTDSGLNNASWVFDSGCPTELTITPTNSALTHGTPVNFIAGGGIPPYTFLIPVNNSGAAINASSGFYTAGNTAGTDTVRVTDGVGATADAAVQVFGLANRLGFVVEPTNTLFGQTITPHVQVAVQDANDNTVANSTASITLSIFNNPSAGTLSGTLVRQAVNGIATFDNLSINNVGTGYTLRAASGGLSAATSDPFNITAEVGVPTKLAFTVQPQDTAGFLSPMLPFTVAIQDGNGNVVPVDSVVVTISPPPGNPTGLFIFGQLTAQTNDGIATFVGTQVFEPVGPGHTIFASAASLTSATSEPFEFFSETTVINTNDNGNGSLRQAIIAGNIDFVDSEIISFNIQSPPPYVIETTELPPINRTVVVDGTTQPGYSGTPIIEIRSSQPGNFDDGIVLSTDSGGVKGLVLTGFERAIRIFGNGNVVQGNYIGTNAAGDIAASNDIGIHIQSSTNNLIGGPAATDRNVISGNVTDGILIEQTSGEGLDNTVQGNFIGTNAAGTSALANSNGIRLSHARGISIIDNVISGNTLAGISAHAGHNFDQTQNGLIQGNIIGLDAVGANPLGNGRQGILLNIANNIRITENRISSNGGLGIQLGTTNNTLNKPPLPNDPGDDIGLEGNRGQNYPALTSAISLAGTTTIAGSLNTRPSSNYTVEFFSSPQCDATGNGEGETFIGSMNVATNASGIIGFTANLPVGVANGRFITATATDSSGNTSEFSRCQIVSARYVISGNVRRGTQRMANVRVELTNSEGKNPTTLTNSNGDFTFSNLPSDDYLLTASHPNFTFLPANRIYQNLSQDQTGQDFGGILQSSSVRGRARTNANGTNLAVHKGGKIGKIGALMPPVPAGGFPLLGVTFDIIGPVVQTVRNDTFGSYNFDGLPPGNYLITPGKPNYVFNPPSAGITVGGVDQTVDFDGESLELSTLSGRIAYDSFGEIYAMNADGSGVVKLAATSSRTFSHSSPKLSANGAKLVYVSQSSTGTATRIVTLNADGTSPETLLNENTGLASPVFSNDGARVAFHNSSGRLFTMNVDGSNVQSPPVNCADADWSPDDTQIVCLENGGGGTTLVKVINPSNSNITTLDGTAGLKFSPRWSPDGAKIAFLRRRPGIGGDHSIVVKDLLGGTDEFMQGPNNLFQTLSWSPDGSRLAFIRDSILPAIAAMPPGGNKQLVTIQSTDGQNMLVIVDGFDGNKIDWGASNSVFTPESPTPTTIQTGAVSITFPTTNGSNALTTVTPIEPNSVGTAPNGFVFGNFAFEISSTAGFTPPVTICVDTDEPGVQSARLMPPGLPALMHNENGVLVNITTSFDELTGILCGHANSFSPFVVAEAVDPSQPSIIGLIVDSNGNAMSGVAVDLTGSESEQTTTDSNGLFVFVNLNEGGNYNVQPRKVGYLFDAYNQDLIAVSGENPVVFTGAELDFEIQGRTVNFLGTGIAGVEVNLTGASDESTLTDSNGNYQFTGLPADGTFTVSPFKFGNSFTPAESDIASLTSSFNGIDFVMLAPTAAGVSVSGRVLNHGRHPLRNVLVTLTDLNGASRRISTNTFGYFRFDDVRVGESYVLSANSRRYSFQSQILSISEDITNLALFPDP